MFSTNRFLSCGTTGFPKINFWETKRQFVSCFRWMKKIRLKPITISTPIQRPTVSWSFEAPVENTHIKFKKQSCQNLVWNNPQLGLSCFDVIQWPYCQNKQIWIRSTNVKRQILIKQRILTQTWVKVWMLRIPSHLYRF